MRGGDVATLLDSNIKRNNNYIIPVGTLTTRETPRVEAVARITPPFAPRKRSTRRKSRKQTRKQTRKLATRRRR